MASSDSIIKAKANAVILKAADDCNEVSGRLRDVGSTVEGASDLAGEVRSAATDLKKLSQGYKLDKSAEKSSGQSVGMGMGSSSCAGDAQSD